MKANVIVVLFCVNCLFVCGSVHAQQAVLSFDDTRALHNFFKFQPGVEPIISGHRGTVEDGFPENSIEAFEHVIGHTAAIFEIDPRLTKDSVIVLFHDATMERTSAGIGKLSDYTWEELQDVRLKDRAGNVTPYKIPKLEDAIRWAKGKTILNLDKKDVPLEMIAALLKELDAYTHVMVTVHTADQAGFYLSHHADQMFSAFVKTPDALQPYFDAGVRPEQMIAYVGPRVTPETEVLHRLLKSHGIRSMISAASSYDRDDDKSSRAAAYKKIISSGATVLESDFPIEVSKVIFP